MSSVIEFFSINIFAKRSILEVWQDSEYVNEYCCKILAELFLVSISFACTSQNPVRLGLRANTSDKNPKPIYVIKRTSGLCEWLLQWVTHWLDQLDHQSSFVCVAISCITWINGSVIRFSKQITSNKCQAYRMKVYHLH